MSTHRTTIDVTTIPRIGHDEAMRIAAVEHQRFADQLASFDTADWTKPTDCARWDVHAVAAHVIGAAAAQAKLLEFRRQVRAGRPLLAELGSPHWWDGMNEVQVIERRDRSPEELVAEWHVAAAASLAARRRLPRPIARLPLLKLPAPVGRQPLAYLFDIGFTRDVWMHRVDLAVATGRPFVADHEHDGRIVADIVAEWAGTHGEPFTLELEGAAGGSYTAGADGPVVHSSATDLCRVLAERLPGEGVLRHPLPL